MVLDISVTIKMSTKEKSFLGKLYLDIEDMDPKRFQNYEGTVTFPEWFCFSVMKDKTLLETIRLVQEAGGTVIPVFVNNLNAVDRVEGIETQTLTEIIRIS